MKRLILALCFFVLFASLLCSQSMRLYDFDSPEYKAVDRLCQISGVVGPSSSTPIVENELYIALQRINPDNLNGIYFDEYNHLIAKLSGSSDSFLYDIDFSISPQLYLSVDYETIENDEFFIPYHKLEPFLFFDTSFEFGDGVYFEAGFEYMNNQAILYKDEEGIAHSSKYGIPLTSFDLLFSYRNNRFYSILPWNPVQLYGEWPSLARGAFGNKWFNVVIGRTPHQIGAGISDNLLVGDNYKFQELLKLTATSSKFTYSLDLTHFDVQDANKKIHKPNFSSPQLLRLIHRLDFVPAKGFRLAANLGFLLYAENIADFRLFTPLFVVHNWYNFNENTTIYPGDEANNIMSFELEWNVIPCLRLGLQFIVDQMQMIWEEDAVPNAVGLMLNGSYIQAFNGGDARYYLECVYNTANLYLNTKFNEDSTTPNYNYDWALGYFRRDTDGAVAWSGSKYGPGAIAVVIGSDISLNNPEMEIKSAISYVGNSDLKMDDPYINKTDRGFIGTPQHKMAIEATLDYKVLSSLDIMGGFQTGFYWNYHHNEGVFKFIPQMMIGIKYKPI